MILLILNADDDDDYDDDADCDGVCDRNNIFRLLGNKKQKKNWRTAQKTMASSDANNFLSGCFHLF